MNIVIGIIVGIAAAHNLIVDLSSIGWICTCFCIGYTLGDSSGR